MDTGWRMDRRNGLTKVGNWGRFLMKGFLAAHSLLLDFLGRRFLDILVGVRVWVLGLLLGSTWPRTGLSELVIFSSIYSKKIHTIHNLLIPSCFTL